ncbi:MAG: glutamate ABC transporter substrate-binding protein [Ilumatobacteraceae bacterium]
MRRRLALAVAAVAVLGACSGDVSLPSAIEAPTTAATTAATTTSLPPDTSGCVDDPKSADYNATRSYEPGPLPSPGAMPAGSTMATIFENGKLRVGVSADTLLFGYRNPLSGTIEGFDIDMLTYVAQAIFGGTHDEARARLDVKVITYAQRLPSLQSGAVDLVAHTMTINCRRWQQIAFSSEYLAAGQRVLVKSGSGFTGIDSLVAAKATVCAPEGSTNLDELSKPEYSGLELIVRPDITDCLVAMQQGEADAASGDDTVLAGFAAQDPTTEVVGDRFTFEPYGIGVNADQRDLVELVNGVLEQVRTNGDWKASYERWLVPTLTKDAADIPAPPAAQYERGS